MKETVQNKDINLLSFPNFWQSKFIFKHLREKQSTEPHLDFNIQKRRADYSAHCLLCPGESTVTHEQCKPADVAHGAGPKRKNQRPFHGDTGLWSRPWTGLFMEGWGRGRRGCSGGSLLCGGIWVLMLRSQCLPSKKHSLETKVKGPVDREHSVTPATHIKELQLNPDLIIQKITWNVMDPWTIIKNILKMKNLSQMYKTKSPFSVLKQKLNYMSSCFNHQYEGLSAAPLRPCGTA